MPKSAQKHLSALAAAALGVTILGFPLSSSAGVSSSDPSLYVHAVNIKSSEFESMTGAEGRLAPAEDSSQSRPDEDQGSDQDRPGASGDPSQVPEAGAEPTAKPSSEAPTQGPPTSESSADGQDGSGADQPAQGPSPQPSDDPSPEPVTSEPVSSPTTAPKPSSSPSTEPAPAQPVSSDPTTLDSNAKLKGRFPVCHFAGGSYHLLTLPYRALVNHGDHHDDVIPPIKGHYAGNRWDNDGIALYGKYCG